MPNTHRTPQKHPQAQGNLPPPPPPAASAQPEVQGLDFHADVVKLVRADNDQGLQQVDGDFLNAFKQKNAQIKRSLTRANNVLTPMEAMPTSQLHNDDISLMRNHLVKIDNAINKLNDHIDEGSLTIAEDSLQVFINEAETHTPSILDLRARITALEQALIRHSTPKTPPPPPAPRRSFKKIDTAFRPKPLHTSATPAIFHKWEQEFLIYVRRNGFDDAPSDEQRRLLHSCLTPEMEEEIQRLCPLREADTLNDILAAIKRHITQSNNLVSLRFAYFNCTQRKGETIREYIIRFRKLGDYASFNNFSYDENMICRLLTGTHSSELRRELLRLKTTDFETVQEFALAWESSHIDDDFIKDTYTARSASTSDIHPDDSGVERVSAYRSNKRATSFSSSSRQLSRDSRPGRTNTEVKKDQQVSSSRTAESCFNCGLSRHPRTSCPARDKVCKYCKKTGHYAKVCKKAKADRRAKESDRPVRSVTDATDATGSDTDDSSADVGNLYFQVCKIQLDECDRAPTPKITPHVYIDGQNVGEYPMLPDTGAAVSVLPAKFVQKWNLSPESVNSGISLRNADGSPIECLGTVRVRVVLGDYSSNVLFFVCLGVKNIILSWVALRMLAVVSPSFPQQSQFTSISEVTQDTLNNIKSDCLRLFRSVFHDSINLREMRGDPMMIHLRSNFNPHDIKQFTRPRPVPVPLRQKVHKQLMDMVQKSIIRPIKEPTDFVSPMVVVPKKNGDVRLVVDYTQVNKFIRRPNHPFPSIADVRASIPSTAKFFATMDAVQGYLQIPLHPSSQPLTAFLTPWGRFCYNRAPMGLSCSGDEYCARGDNAFHGIPNIIKVVDDILVYADTQDSLRSTLMSVLEAAKHHGISLSPAKFFIGTRVDFVGLDISQDCIRPDAKHFQAISNFPQPKNRTDLRSFLGMANQFAPFTSDIARLAKPLRPLLTKSSSWNWDTSHQQAFLSLRSALVGSNSLHCFDPTRPTSLLTDASKLNGLGYALIQETEKGPALISCGSRFVMETEANYAIFELEALAIVWAITKCRIFLLGIPHFKVITDHRPLVAIFNSTRLSKTDNPRIVRLLQKVSMYTFEVHWVPGKTHSIPDALSRNPIATVSSLQPTDQDLEVRIYPDLAVRSMASQALIDTSYQDVVQALRTMDVKDVKKLPLSTHSHVRILTSLWQRLSVDPGSKLILLDSSRILVPKASRTTVLKRVHVAHQGITRTKSRMQALYFWPGMTNEIVQAVESCPSCQKYRDLQPSQPFLQHDKPQRPFQAVSLDIFEYRRCFFMTYVDRFSGWPSVACFKQSPSSKQIIGALINVFKDFSVPEVIRHDGARPLVSTEFVTFLKQYNIRDQVSSAYNPQSNGHAEASVKAMKLMVKKAWLNNTLDTNKFAESILEWRNTPKYPGKLSPAELVFGRKLRSRVPCISYGKISEKTIQHAVQNNFQYQAKMYDKSNCRKRRLTKLLPGDRVLLRNPLTKVWDQSGVIRSSRNLGRSFIIDVNGKLLLRNRRLLRKQNTT